MTIHGGPPPPRLVRSWWSEADPAPRLGLRANRAQFLLLMAVNALVGGMIGQERTVLPLLAEQEYGLSAYSASLTFIIAFGLTKAGTNLVAGTLADRWGRRPVLVLGWIIGLPVPLILIWAPSWTWVVIANMVLGVNQGLTWSTTVIMKIDLVGPHRRGLAMGLNEAAGYGAVAITAMATGWLAETHGLRPAPFLLGLAYAGMGLGLSSLFVRETRHHVRLETLDTSSIDLERTSSRTETREPSLCDSNTATLLRRSVWSDPTLSSCSQAGMVNNLNDGLAWGLFPILFAAAGLSVGRIGILAALYPAAWGGAQLVTGWLSDHLGRRPLIVGGLWLQAGALAWMAAVTGFGPWAVGAVALGLGTALVYPTLLAAIGDTAHPSWRARAVGVYRLWRDGGFAVGALVAGGIADLVSIEVAIVVVAALTAASGVLVAVRMAETTPDMSGRRS